jgi:hypothetical protein
MVCGLLHLFVGGCQQLPPSPPFWSCYSLCMTLMVCGLLHDVAGWLAGPSCLARPQSVGSGEKQQQQQQRNKDVTGTDTISLTGWVSCCDVGPPLYSGLQWTLPASFGAQGNAANKRSHSLTVVALQALSKWQPDS